MQKIGSSRDKSEANIKIQELMTKLEMECREYSFDDNQTYALQQFVLYLLNNSGVVSNNNSCDEATKNFNLKVYLEKIEIALINKALVDANNVVSNAATILGVKRTTLVEKIKKYKLHRKSLQMD